MTTNIDDYLKKIIEKEDSLLVEKRSLNTIWLRLEYSNLNETQKKKLKDCIYQLEDFLSNLQ